jgi:molybdopterin molybdotransferase
MINIKTAQQLIADQVHPITETEEISFRDAMGRVLSSDIESPCQHPHFDNSAMDGYAVRADDTTGASESTPCTLDIIGEVRAGQAGELEVQSGQAVRIMTGAATPEGADAIVMVERTKETDDQRVEIYAEAKRQDHLRFAGEDVATGQTVLKANTVIRPFEIGMFATLGIDPVPVYRKPVVALLTTGDEILSDITETLPPGMIRDSVYPMLQTSLANVGITPHYPGTARDTAPLLQDKIAGLLALKPDVLMLSGGVSKGKYDLVKNTLHGFNFNEIFHKVRIKPGKPLLFGTIDNTLVFGLPGNPVSSLTSFHVFVKPVVLQLMHKPAAGRHIPATLSQEYIKKGDRTHIVRVYYETQNGVTTAQPLYKQGSAMVSSLTDANGYIVVDADTPSVQKGADVTVIPFD